MSRRIAASFGVVIAVPSLLVINQCSAAVPIPRPPLFDRDCDSNAEGGFAGFNYGWRGDPCIYPVTEGHHINGTALGLGPLLLLVAISMLALYLCACCLSKNMCCCCCSQKKKRVAELLLPIDDSQEITSTHSLYQNYGTISGLDLDNGRGKPSYANVTFPPDANPATYQDPPPYSRTDPFAPSSTNPLTPLPNAPLEETIDIDEERQNI